MNLTAANDAEHLPPAVPPLPGLARGLRGDLDNIVLKALRKEPARRYASAEQFAEDIRRHLQGLPVSAVPDSWLYRVRKFVGRNKLGVAAAALTLLAIAGGIFATLLQARIAAANQVRAEQRFNDVRKLANSLLFEIHDSIQDLPGSIPARKLLVERALQYLDSLARESGSDRSLQRELASAYVRVADVQGYPFRQNLGDTQGALQSYRRALAIEEALVRAHPDSIDDALDLATVHRRLAEIESMSQDMLGALAEGQRAVEIGESLSRTPPSQKKILQGLLKDYQTLAGIEGGNSTGNLGHTEAALAFLQKAVGIAEQLQAAEPKDPVLLRSLGGAVMRYGDQLELVGQRQAAYQQYLRGLAIVKSLASPGNATSQEDVAEGYARVGFAQFASADLRSAQQSLSREVEIYKLLFQPGTKDVDSRIGLELAYAELGDVESKMGHSTMALEALQSAQTIGDQDTSASPTAEVRSYQALVRVLRGEALARTRQMDAALRYYREALARYLRLHQDDPANVDTQVCLAATHNRIGRALLRKSGPEQASGEFDEALKLVQLQGRSDNANVEMLYLAADAYSGLGDAMVMRALEVRPSLAVQRQHWQQAQSFYQESLKMWGKIHEPGLVSPSGFDCVPPATVTRNLERCQEALKRLGANGKRNA